MTTFPHFTSSDDIDPRNARHVDLIHRKLVYALDARPVFWWKRGVKYGVVEGVVTPLWGMWVFFVQQVTDHRKSDFDVRSLEAVYLTDLETGHVIDRFRNPYTGEVLPVPGRLMGPDVSTLGTENRTEQSSLPGIEIDRSHAIGPLVIVGDNLWLSVDTTAEVTRTARSDASPFRVHDLETFHGSAADIVDPGMVSAPASASLHLMSSWQGWLDMGDRPGSQVTRLTAAKAFDFDGIPKALQTLISVYHPDVADDPVAALARPPESFER